MTDTLHYDQMVENALRGVVREALERTRKEGLPGNHHFYITFRTGFPGVKMPDYLRAKYPQEMTIVLQHQFWDLTVDDTGFSVGLSFNKVQEQLAIPYVAVTSFADPSVQFGLQFKVDERAPREVSVPVPAAAAEAPPAPADEAAPAQDRTGEAGDGTNVVSLDTFRKK